MNKLYAHLLGMLNYEGKVSAHVEENKPLILMIININI